MSDQEVHEPDVTEEEDRPTAEQIADMIRRAPISQIQGAFRLLGWKIELVVSERPENDA
jgi:hypothetical protein